MRDYSCNLIFFEFGVIEEFRLYGNVHVLFESSEGGHCKFADVLIVAVDGGGEAIFGRNEDAVDFADL